MILFLFMLIYASSFFIPQDMPILYGVSCEILLVMLCWSNFLKTPFSKMIQKSGWFCMTTWTFFNLIIFTWFQELCLVNYVIFAVETLIFASMFFYSQFRSYNVESSEYSEEKCYIVFKKPHSFFDFVHSFIFRPVSSVSVVSSGWWYGYTLGRPYHCEMYRENDEDVLIEICYLNNGFVKECLIPLVGSRWNPLNNCCHAVQRLFPLLKFNLFDSLPSHIIKTIKKERAEGCQPKK